MNSEFDDENLNRVEAGGGWAGRKGVGRGMLRAVHVVVVCLSAVQTVSLSKRVNGPPQEITSQRMAEKGREFPTKDKG